MKFYRAGSLPRHPVGRTALDVVQHEETTGYLSLYSTVGRAWLRSIPADRCTWFCKRVEDALQYSYSCALAEVDCYSLYDFVIIAEDNELGYLVVDLS